MPSKHQSTIDNAMEHNWKPNSNKYVNTALVTITLLTLLNSALLLLTLKTIKDYQERDLQAAVNKVDEIIGDVDSTPTE